MKIRSGFISNSSSSSFVLAGIKFDANNKFDYEDFEKHGFDILNDGDTYYVGETISHFSDAGESEFDISDVSKSLEKVKAMFEKLNIDSDDIKIYHVTAYN